VVSATVATASALGAGRTVLASTKAAAAARVNISNEAMATKFSSNSKKNNLTEIPVEIRPRKKTIGGALASGIGPRTNTSISVTDDGNSASTAGELAHEISHAVASRKAFNSDYAASKLISYSAESENPLRLGGFPKGYNDSSSGMELEGRIRQLAMLRQRGAPVAIIQKIANEIKDFITTESKLVDAALDTLDEAKIEKLGKYYTKLSVPPSGPTGGFKVYLHNELMHSGEDARSMFKRILEARKEHLEGFRQRYVPNAELEFH
jgi:hypothetical protein